MTLNELAQASGLPKSTVPGLLVRLVELGAIEAHRSGYKVGLGMFRLGSMPPAVGEHSVWPRSSRTSATSGCPASSRWRGPGRL